MNRNVLKYLNFLFIFIGVAIFIFVIVSLIKPGADEEKAYNRTLIEKCIEKGGTTQIGVGGRLSMCRFE